MGINFERADPRPPRKIAEKAVWRPPGFSPVPPVPGVEDEARRRAAARARLAELTTAEREERRRVAQLENYAKYRAAGNIASAARAELNRTVDAMMNEGALRKVNTNRIPDVRFMSAEQKVNWARALMIAQRYDWRHNARPEQIQPLVYQIWLILCGRGWGKTRCGSEAVREWVTTPNTRVAVIARDSRSLRDVNFEGVSGLLAVIPKELQGEYTKGLGDVKLWLKNGSLIQGYTCQEPGALRGPSFDAALLDEYAAWPRSIAQETLDMVQMCLRESEDPRIIIATTPKRVPHVKALIKESEDPEAEIVITRGKTSDNTKLGTRAVNALKRRYKGTRLGRQELDGELIDDVTGALWNDEMVNAAQYDGDLPKFKAIITAVDPSGSADVTADQTGIVVVGLTRDNKIFVLENNTVGGFAADRYNEACRSAYRWKTTEVVVESAFSGDNSRLGFTNQWEHLVRTGDIDRPCPPVAGATIRGDKRERALPVAALYEQQLNTEYRNIWHVRDADPGNGPLDPEGNGEGNGLALLEDEMCEWSPEEKKKSPNAMDALVYGVRRCLVLAGLEMTVGRGSSRRKPKGGQSYDPFA